MNDLSHFFYFYPTTYVHTLKQGGDSPSPPAQPPSLTLDPSLGKQIVPLIFF